MAGLGIILCALRPGDGSETKLKSMISVSKVQYLI